MDNARCAFCSIWIFPIVDFAIYRIDDTISYPTHHSVSIFVQRIGDFAAGFAVCPNSHYTFALLLRVFNFPIYPLAVFSFWRNINNQGT